MKHCNSCKNIKSLTEFSKNKNSKDGLQLYCKLCSNEYFKKYHKNNRNKRLKYFANWKKQNPDKHCAHQALRRAKKLNRMLLWGKQKLKKDIDIWYKRAKLATIFTGEKYSVDHIIPLQGDNVSGLHVPWNLQLLTQSENSSKGNKHVDKE